MDSDPFSALARAMRICTDVELARLLQMIEEQWDQRDQRRVDDALANRTLLCWASPRGLRDRLVHSVANVRGEVYVGRYGASSLETTTLCGRAFRSVSVWPEGQGQVRRDISIDETYRICPDVVLTCERCLKRRNKNNSKKVQ